MYPALTATALTPTARQASATSIAYSMKITGSLYVKATLRQPSRTAVWASASGEASELSVSISRDFEISQFWQNRHARLQPAVPKDSTGVPGRKWLSGFFSTGSTQNPDERPYDASTTWSSTRPRTKHSPRCPSRSLQARGQTSHWIRPSGSACQCRVATVYGSSSRRSVMALPRSTLPRVPSPDGLEPAQLRPARTRHVRARRGGAPDPATGPDPARRGVALPALRRLRPRCAARQRSGVRRARGDARPGPAGRGDPAPARGRARRPRRADPRRSV